MYFIFYFCEQNPHNIVDDKNIIRQSDLT